MNKRRLILIFLIGKALVSAGQFEQKRETDFQRVIDELFPEGLYENPDAYETLFNTFQTQLDLNQITREELVSLIILSEPQINNFLEYRAEYGPFLSIYELQAIDGFGVNEIRGLLLFCYLRNNPSLLPRDNSFRHSVLLRYIRTFPDKDGFMRPDSAETRFLGDPNKYLVRYNFTKGSHWEGGFTLDKDAGEQFLFEPEKGIYGFDFSSFHLSLKNKGIVKRLTLGDYKFQSGQGLVYAPLFSMGFGANPIVNNSKRARLQPNNSSYEFRNFRGLGATLGKNGLSTSLILSDVNRDATVYENPENGGGYFKSFRKSGYHRTPSEVNSSRSVKERHLGINADYLTKDKKLNLGLNYGHTWFSLPMKRDDNAAERYGANGKKHRVYSSYVNAFLTNTLIFGEIAVSANKKGMGMLAGITRQFRHGLALTTIYRNYQPGFHSFKSNAIAQKAGNNNEKGIYVGLKAEPFRNVTISGYIDNYSSHWLGFSIDRPSVAREWALTIDYSKYRFFRFSMINKSIKEESNLSESPNPFQKISSFSRYKTIMNAIFFIRNQFVWKTRVQWSSAVTENTETNGFLMYSGINFEHKKIRISGGINIFDTDDYENRQYIYINSLPYAYIYKGFQDRGSNLNIAAHIRYSRNILFSVNFIQTMYKNKKEMGNGVDKITGNKVSEFGAQLTIKL